MHGADSLIERAEIEKLLQSGDGCRLEGHLEVNKIAGNFHIGKLLKVFFKTFELNVKISSKICFIAPGVSFEKNHMVCMNKLNFEKDS